MKKIKHSCMIVVALALAGFTGLQTVQAGVIAASNLTDGAVTYTTTDTLVTLTPYAIVSNSVAGVFGATNDLFGVQGGGNDLAVNDQDGSPFTEDDREAIDIALDATVGLTEIAFVFSRANGPASNGVPSGIVISGFLEDPGVWTDTTVVGTYTNGALYLNYDYDSGTVRTFGFTNLNASAGETLRLSVNDLDQTNAQVAVSSISYGDEPFMPPPSSNGVIVASSIANGAANHVSNDGLVTLTPLAQGLSTGSFGSNESTLFGVTGGHGDNSLGDRDGDPATTFDREAMDIELDGLVGLTQIAFVWARANGGEPSGVVISGFTEDPGIWSELGDVINTYTNGTLYFDLNNWSGTPRVYNFASAAASTGQVLRLSVNDLDQADPRLSISSIAYAHEGIEPPEPPPEPHPPIGEIVASNIVDGVSSYTTGDGLVALTPYSIVSNSVVGVFGVGATWFGIKGGGNDTVIRDLDGSPFTTADRQALDITLDGAVALSEIGFFYSRADGPASNGVPSGIVISGFSEDPVVATGSGVTSTYTNGAVYLNYGWDSGFERKFNFQNLEASAGQVIRISVNDFNEASPQAGISLIAYAEAAAPQSAVLSIGLVAEQLLVTATNLTSRPSVTNTLQGATDLSIDNWVDIVSTAGVEQVTWPVDESDPERFFRVISN